MEEEEPWQFVGDIEEAVVGRQVVLDGDIVAGGQAVSSCVWRSLLTKDILLIDYQQDWKTWQQGLGTSFVLLVGSARWAPVFFLCTFFKFFGDFAIS